MNENHLQRSLLRKLFQNGFHFNKNDYSERKSSEKGKPGYHFYTDVGLLRRYFASIRFCFVFFQELDLYFLFLKVKLMPAVTF